MTDLSLVVTGAYYGRRLKSFGPKPLWEVTPNRTVFDLQLRVFNRHCTTRPVVVGGFEVNRLRRCLGHVATVVEDPDWRLNGSAYSAQLGVQNARPGRVVVAHGDVLFTPFPIPPSGSWVVSAVNHNADCGEVGVTTSSGWVSNMDYGLKPRWSQSVILDDHERRIFESLPLKKETLHEAVNRVVDRGGRLALLSPPRLQILDLDTPRDLREIKDFPCVS